MDNNRRPAVWAPALAAAALLAACSSGGPPAPAVRPERVDPVLVSPLEGYPLTSPADLAARVEALSERLQAGGDLAALGGAVDALLSEAPEFHPSAVLAAQIEYLSLDDRAAVERLEPIAGELPDYFACQWVRALAAERLGDVVIAFEAFTRAARAEVEVGAGLAARRAAALCARASEVVFHRLDEALARGQVEIAEGHRQWLEQWVGEERLLLEAGRRILVAEGDREGELEVVCQLMEIEPTLALRQRCAELEIDVGDVRSGLELFEQLAAELPDDAAVAEGLERAKFRWRLELLPVHVRELGRKGELLQADLATLLHWLAPRVRSHQVTDPPIATDILDHPLREEILKVVDLDLMRVDEVLHRFDPDRPVARLTVFAALLRLLELSERGIPCLGGAAPRTLPTAPSWVCEKAAACRLIPEVAECLPRATISGGETLDYFRRSLDLMGAGQASGTISGGGG